MSGQNIGKVTLPGQSIGTVSVKIGQTSNPKAISINYGTGRTLTSLTDVNAMGVVNNEVLTYAAEIDSFVFKPIVDTQLTIDNGFF
jgi:hypothetical protein